MRISYNWLQEYFEAPLPKAEELGKLLTMHAFEVESIEIVGNDKVLDIKVLPDRSHDSLCHIGIAREISVLANVKLKPELSDPKEMSAPESNVLRVDIEDTKKCRRFSALVIEHIEVKESPDWLKASLESMGQRSVNNVVDATNFVMFNMGQPLHAYDKDLLTADGGSKIVVRGAKSGETLTALDNKEYSFDENDLLIVDGNTNKPLGVAGVKGGKACEISTKTKHLILEAANFDPISVRKTAKKLGLRTDASVRFENEITPDLTLRALKEVSDLLFRIAKTDETQVEGLVDIYPRRPNPYTVGVSLTEINHVLGISISQNEVESILNRKGYAWELINPREKIVETAGAVIGAPYKFGASVSYDSPRLFDCSSLVAYAYTRAGLAVPRMCAEQYAFGQEISETDALPGDIVFFKGQRKDVPEGIPGHDGIYVGNGEMIHAGGVDIGYGQVVRENIVDSKYTPTGLVGYRRLVPNDEVRYVVTIPAERLDLTIKEDLIEEVGRTYGYEGLKPKAIQVSNVPVEIEKSNHYAQVLRAFFLERGFSEVITYVFRQEGEVSLQNPLASDKAFLRANLASGMNEALLLNNHNKDLLGLEEVKIFEIGNVFTSDGEFLSVAFSGGKIEEVSNELSKLLGTDITFDLQGKVYESNLSKVLDALLVPTVLVPEVAHIADSARFTAFSQYPVVLRDIAVFVPEGEANGDIIEIVKKEAGDLLVNFRLFDTFTKEFPEGKKTSYAYRLVFQSMDKTLSDEEINPIMEKVSADLNARAGWQVR